MQWRSYEVWSSNATTECSVSDGAIAKPRGWWKQRSPSPRIRLQRQRLVQPGQQEDREPRSWKHLHQLRIEIHALEALDTRIEYHELKLYGHQARFVHGSRLHEFEEIPSQNWSTTRPGKAKVLVHGTYHKKVVERTNSRLPDGGAGAW